MTAISQDQLKGALDAYSQAIHGPKLNPVDPAGLGPSVLAGTAVQKSATNAEGWNVNLDLIAYSLDAPAKVLIPFTTKFRNMTPRTSMGVSSNVARWKTIYERNAGSSIITGGIAENAVGSNIVKSSEDKYVTLKQYGVKDYIGMDAQFYGRSFQEYASTSKLLALQTLMEIEEDDLLFGNITDLTATNPGTPAGTVADTGGTIPDSTDYRCKVVQLTMEGYRIYNATSSTWAGSANPKGCSTPSGSSATVSSGTGGAGNLHTIAWTCTGCKNAVAYVWYIDKASSGNYYKQAVTTVNTWTQTADISGTSAVPTVNMSGNAYSMDGLYAQYIAGRNAEITSLDNAALASDSASGISAVTTMLSTLFDRTHRGPQYALMNGAMANRITALTTGSSAPIYRVQMTEQQAIGAGFPVPKSLYNPFTSEEIDIIVSPRMPPNMIIFPATKSPYDYSNVGSAFDVAIPQGADYYEIQYPMTTTDGRVWPFGIYSNEALRVYWDGGGILYNVKATA